MPRPPSTQPRRDPHTEARPEYLHRLGAPPRPAPTAPTTRPHRSRRQRNSDARLRRRTRPEYLHSPEAPPRPTPAIPSHVANAAAPSTTPTRPSHGTPAGVPAPPGSTATADSDGTDHTADTGAPFDNPDAPLTRKPNQSTRTAPEPASPSRHHPGTVPHGLVLRHEPRECLPQPHLLPCGPVQVPEQFGRPHQASSLAPTPGGPAAAAAHRRAEGTHGTPVWPCRHRNSRRVQSDKLALSAGRPTECRTPPSATRALSAPRSPRPPAPAPDPPGPAGSRHAWPPAR
ncbi:hypothetical protein SCANM124S_02958 [Streptomyces canus]